MNVLRPNGYIFVDVSKPNGLDIALNRILLLQREQLRVSKERLEVERRLLDKTGPNRN